MSTYTNDVDALRECLSQSIPQVFSASITMITVLISMFTTNIYLTLSCYSNGNSYDICIKIFRRK